MIVEPVGIDIGAGALQCILQTEAGDVLLVYAVGGGRRCVSGRVLPAGRWRSSTVLGVHVDIRGLAQSRDVLFLEYGVAM